VNVHTWSAKKVRGQIGQRNAEKGRGHDRSTLSRKLWRDIRAKVWTKTVAKKM